MKNNFLLAIALLCSINTCIANILLQAPTQIGAEHIDPSSSDWDATFGREDGSYNFLYHNGRAGLRITNKESILYTSHHWQELADRFPTPENAQEKSYYIDEVRDTIKQGTHEPTAMSMEEAANYISNHAVVFYTGAGISIASGVGDMATLEKSLNLHNKMPILEYVSYVRDNEQAVLDAFTQFCQKAFTVPATQAHDSLARIALHKKTQIMTENFDLLHQRSGIMPFELLMNTAELRNNVSPNDLQKIDAIICIGLSHDDRGFLGWYKRHNPRGIIIAFDIASPSYLGKEDFLVTGDAQETIPALEQLIKKHAEPPMHLVRANQEFQATNDQVIYEQRKAALAAYYTAGAYDTDVQTICQRAIAFFTTLSPDPHAAVIFDIDDTAIFTVPTGWEVGFIWPQSANTYLKTPQPAVAPVHTLYVWLRERGIKIIFLTARPEKQYHHTIHELTQAGYTEFEHCILLPSHINPTETASWKCATRKQLASQYSIIGCIGDRPSDFEGGYTGYEMRLPNYIY